MRRSDILHHPFERLDIVYRYPSAALLGVDNDAAGIVGIVAQLDQDVDLSAAPTDSTDNPRVRRDAVLTLTES